MVHALISATHVGKEFETAITINKTKFDLDRDLSIKVVELSKITYGQRRCAILYCNGCKTSPDQ
jgi:hypothetical protein